MDVRQLAELRLQTGYLFENGTPFYEKLGEKRADALLKRTRLREPRRTRWCPC